MLLSEYIPFRNTVRGEVGIEVEMEGRTLPDLVNGWRVKTDGSLRGLALEYILPEPVSRKTAELRIRSLYENFKQYEITPSDRCGVHIHLNVRDLEIEKIYNCIITYLVVEDVLMRWCGDSREGNLFCLRARDAEWMIYQLIGDRQQGIFNAVTNNETFKYSSQNLAAIRRFGSLEYRGLETPAKVDRIITWMKLLYAVRDYALKVENTTDIINEVCRKTPRTYLLEMLGKDLFNEVKCKNMGQMILDGARRVQAVAFTPLGEYKKKEVIPSDFDAFLQATTIPTLRREFQPIFIATNIDPMWTPMTPTADEEF